MAVVDDVEFGRFAPGPLLAVLLRLSHKEQSGFIARMASSIAGRIVGSSIGLHDVEVGGLRLRCRFSDNYSEKKFVFSPWRFDTYERQYIASSLPRDGVFFDIGANVGIYTLTAARVMTGRGRVVSFEPNPETMERLRFNIAATMMSVLDAPKIETLQFGVADRESEFSLAIHPGNLGGSTIAEGKSKQLVSLGSKTVTIRCRPLLEVCNDLAVTSIDMLKIDIEGAEDIALVPFLNTAPESLFPGSIIVENSENVWTQDLPGVLKSKGYSPVYRGPMNSIYKRG